MIKKFFCSIFLLALILIPFNTFALNEEEDNFELVAQEEKYYKTTTVLNNKEMSTMSNSNNSELSITEEITKEEYDSYLEPNISPNVSAAIETTYKKLTTSILSNGSYYRYKAVLDWKNMPKVRSYDTIAIGHYASVKLRGNLQFSQTYCYSSGDCRTTSAYYPHTFTAGSSATFKLPEGTFSSLTQTFYFDVQKAVNSNVVKQNASGDYAHATKSINYINAQKFTVSNSGIDFDSTVMSYFDEIQVARAIWTGNW